MNLMEKKSLFLVLSVFVTWCFSSYSMKEKKLALSHIVENGEEKDLGERVAKFFEKLEGFNEIYVFDANKKCNEKINVSELKKKLNDDLSEVSLYENNYITENQKKDINNFPLKQYNSIRKNKTYKIELLDFFIKAHENNDKTIISNDYVVFDIFLEMFRGHLKQKFCIGYLEKVLGKKSDFDFSDVLKSPEIEVADKSYFISGMLIFLKNNHGIDAAKEFIKSLFVKKIFISSFESEPEALEFFMNFFKIFIDNIEAGYKSIEAQKIFGDADCKHFIINATKDYYNCDSITQFDTQVVYKKLIELSEKKMDVSAEYFFYQYLNHKIIDSELLSNCRKTLSLIFTEIGKYLAWQEDRKLNIFSFIYFLKNDPKKIDFQNNSQLKWFVDYIADYMPGPEDFFTLVNNLQDTTNFSEGVFEKLKNVWKSAFESQKSLQKNEKNRLNNYTFFFDEYSWEENNGYLRSDFETLILDENSEIREYCYSFEEVLKSSQKQIKLYQSQKNQELDELKKIIKQAIQIKVDEFNRKTKRMQALWLEYKKTNDENDKKAIWKKIEEKDFSETSVWGTAVSFFNQGKEVIEQGINLICPQKLEKSSVIEKILGWIEEEKPGENLALYERTTVIKIPAEQDDLRESQVLNKKNKLEKIKIDIKDKENLRSQDINEYKEKIDLQYKNYSNQLEEEKNTKIQKLNHDFDFWYKEQKTAYEKRKENLKKQEKLTKDEIELKNSLYANKSLLESIHNELDDFFSGRGISDNILTVLEKYLNGEGGNKLNGGRESLPEEEDEVKKFLSQFLICLDTQFKSLDKEVVNHIKNYFLDSHKINQNPLNHAWRMLVSKKFEFTKQNTDCIKNIISYVLLNFFDEDCFTGVNDDSFFEKIKQCLCGNEQAKKNLFEIMDKSRQKFDFENPNHIEFAKLMLENGDAELLKKDSLYITQMVYFLSQWEDLEKTIISDYNLKDIINNNNFWRLCLKNQDIKNNAFEIIKKLINIDAEYMSFFIDLFDKKENNIEEIDKKKLVDIISSYTNESKLKNTVFGLIYNMLSFTYLYGSDDDFEKTLDIKFIKNCLGKLTDGNQTKPQISLTHFYLLLWECRKNQNLNNPIEAGYYEKEKSNKQDIILKLSQLSQIITNHKNNEDKKDRNNQVVQFIKENFTELEKYFDKPVFSENLFTQLFADILNLESQLYKKPVKKEKSSANLNKEKVQEDNLKKIYDDIMNLLEEEKNKALNLDNVDEEEKNQQAVNILKLEELREAFKGLILASFYTKNRFEKDPNYAEIQCEILNKLCCYWNNVIFAIGDKKWCTDNHIPLDYLKKTEILPKFPVYLESLNIFELRYLLELLYEKKMEFSTSAKIERYKDREENIKKVEQALTEKFQSLIIDEVCPDIQERKVNIKCTNESENQNNSQYQSSEITEENLNKSFENKIKEIQEKIKKEDSSIQFTHDINDIFSKEHIKNLITSFQKFQITAKPRVLVNEMEIDGRADLRDLEELRQLLNKWIDDPSEMTERKKENSEVKSYKKTEEEFNLLNKDVLDGWAKLEKVLEPLLGEKKNTMAEEKRIYPNWVYRPFIQSMEKVCNQKTIQSEKLDECEKAISLVKSNIASFERAKKICIPLAIVAVANEAITADDLAACFRSLPQATQQGLNQAKEVIKNTVSWATQNSLFVKALDLKLAISVSDSIKKSPLLLKATEFIKNHSIFLLCGVFAAGSGVKYWRGKKDREIKKKYLQSVQKIKKTLEELIEKER